MEITLTLKDLGFIVIIVSAAAFLINAAMLMSNLINTVKHTNSILEDSKIMSQIAADRTQDVNKVVLDIVEIMTEITETVKSNQGILTVISTVFGGAMAIKGSIRKNKKKSKNK